MFALTGILATFGTVSTGFPAPTEDEPRFRLRLDSKVLDSDPATAKGEFTLGIELPSETDGRSDPEREPAASPGSLDGLEARIEISPGVADPFNITRDLPDWNDNRTPLERHIAADNLRNLEGGFIGQFDPAPLISVATIVNLIRSAIEARRERERTIGIDTTDARALDIFVVEADGSSPSAISVVPLSPGFVWDTLHSGCDEGGRCRLQDVPGNAHTALVRGTGTAVVPLDAPLPEIGVRLKPNVRLRIQTPQTTDAPPIRCRLVEETSNRTVPIVRWLNPDRDEWFEVAGEGLTLHLPQGDYRLETAIGDAAPRIRSLNLSTDRTLFLSLDFDTR